jgi:hypothetical protein
MDRTFSLGSVVVLPRMDVQGALAIGAETLSFAQRLGPLPATLIGARDKLAQRLVALEQAVEQHPVRPPRINTSEVRAADQRLDSAWIALSLWLEGYAHLPQDDPATGELAVRARHAYERLFSDGLGFTQLAFKLEWAASEEKLRLLRDDPGLEADLRTMGGSVFLTCLRAAHQLYGRVLGLSADAAPTGAPLVQQALDEFRRALRSYVVQVSAFGDAEPKRANLARELLAPLGTPEFLSATLREGATVTTPSPPPARRP